MFEVPTNNWHLAVEPSGGRWWRNVGFSEPCDRAAFVHASGRFVFLPVQAQRADDIIIPGDTLRLRIGDGGEFDVRCTEAQLWNLGVVFKAEPASEKREEP